MSGWRARLRLSPRRRAVLALLLAVLAVLAWMGWVGTAGIVGTPARSMDWNGDGVVTRGEILQGFFSVVVVTSHDGNRECRSYQWRASGEQIRVECTTKVAP
ncbi:MAG: hypothetical protein QM601_11030 [Pseudoxanthomonas sp.]